MENEWLDVIEELTRRAKDKPIVVGGFAVEFYTAGMYSTGDIDLIGSSDELFKILQSMGFKKEDRLFIKGKIAIDIVGSRLYGRFSELDVSDRKTKLRFISIEDLLVDRLCACKFWRSATDCEQATYLWNVYKGRFDEDYLRERAAEENVLDRLKELD
jgi:hypothetical protein